MDRFYVIEHPTRGYLAYPRDRGMDLAEPYFERTRPADASVTKFFIRRSAETTVNRMPSNVRRACTIRFIREA